MLYWKCQCGESEYWGSGMSPADCDVCSKCKTTMTGNKPKRHKYKILYNQNTGKPYKYCTNCNRRQKEILKEKLTNL